MQASLLIEIGTEELPPKRLQALSAAFAANMAAALVHALFEHGAITAFATPRRLALQITALVAEQPLRRITRELLLSAAFDAQGNPTQAALGIARSFGTTVDKLSRGETNGKPVLIAERQEPGKKLTEVLPDLLEQVLKALPTPKRMRWGSGQVEFVRPVRWVVLLYGQQCISATIMGVQSSDYSYGHRFHAPQAIPLTDANEYVSVLRNTGKVMVDYDQRKATIRQQIHALAAAENGVVHINETLLDEVTALVEWPTAILGKFDPRFLTIPKEALILALQHHQKAFVVENVAGLLLPYFIAISNIESLVPSQVVQGNERVVAARLADAEFFYQTDLQHPLEEHLTALKQVLFQDKLGSLYDKSQRVAQLAAYLAQQVGGNVDFATRAGLLSKTDLMTEMVGEFPELQGIMGYYYAKHSGEPHEVALAIKEHYLFAKDDLPTSVTGAILSIADKLDTLVGIFALQQIPTGEKDPYALRRAAFGVLRILLERQWPIDLSSVLTLALQAYPPVNLEPSIVVQQATAFILERLYAYYQEEEGIRPEMVSAVMAVAPSPNPWDIHLRIQSIFSFLALPQAEALAAANKRASNLLAKSDAASTAFPLNEHLLTPGAEQDLARQVIALQTESQGNYTQRLQALATLREPIDRFFEEVRVNTEDEALRNNRLALLREVRGLFLQVADISELRGLK